MLYLHRRGLHLLYRVPEGGRERRTGFHRISKYVTLIINPGHPLISFTVASTQPVPPPKTTPLLEALKAEKSAAKDKEAILRNHAHYKQGDAAARKEDKKKATASVPTPKVAADAQPLPSKKKKVFAQEQSQVSDVQFSGIAVNKSTPRNVPPPTPIPKPVTQNSSSIGSSHIARPPRPPKSRQGPPNKALATSGSVPAPNKSDASASTSTNNPPVPASQAEPARRPRPVIASRQFEAALNIAGLATSASDRRKREKEKVKDAVSTATVDDNNATSSRLSKRELQITTSTAQASGSSGLDTEAQSPLPSPNKDRSKRGGRPGGPGRAGTQSSSVANLTPIKIPSILQRSDTVASSSAVVVPRSSNADLSPTKSDLPSGGTASPPRGRGRRGRGVGGRGVGRGGGRGGQATTVPRESG